MCKSIWEAISRRYLRSMVMTQSIPQSIRWTLTGAVIRSKKKSRAIVSCRLTLQLKTLLESRRVKSGPTHRCTVVPINLRLAKSASPTTGRATACRTEARFFLCRSRALRTNTCTLRLPKITRQQCGSTGIEPFQRLTSTIVMT